VHDNLIDFLGPGGGSERSQHKKSGQKSDINRFHNFSFCVVWSVVSGSRLPWGVATHGPRPAIVQTIILKTYTLGWMRLAPRCKRLPRKRCVNVVSRKETSRTEVEGEYTLAQGAGG